jgi:hypothetical protein
MKRVTPGIGILFAVLFIVLVPLTVHSQIIVSRPVGFVRVQLPSGAQTLVSNPFKPLDNSINAILSGQLIGSTNANQADKVLKWDNTNAQYISAVKVDGTGNPTLDKKWFADLVSLTPSDMTLSPGEGFFLQNNQEFMEAVYLSGEITLDLTNSTTILPSLNLIGYPYSTPIVVTNTSLLDGDAILSGDQLIDPTGELSITNILIMGRGYWYNNSSTTARIWNELRPYSSLFSESAMVPSVTSITPMNGGVQITLAISCYGIQTVDIFYKDLSEDGTFDPIRNWELAETNGVPASGASAVNWTDYGSTNRLPVNLVDGRVYLVADADIDSNGDGIPDARAQFVYGMNVQTNASMQTSMSAASNMASLVTTNTPVQTSSITGSVFYVDTVVGSDNLSGLTQVVAGNNGPKKTIKAGLNVAAPGGTLVIKAGHYAEDLNIAGRNISVVLNGNVDISGNLAGASIPVLPMTANPTNVVCVSTNSLPE